MNKKFLIILTGVFFAVLFAVNLLLFNFAFAEPALMAGTAITWVAVAILSLVIASHYGMSNKSSSAERRKLGDYLKNIWLIIIFMTVLSYALSFAGGILVSFIMMIIRNSVGGEYLNGAFFVIPLFMIYLTVLYRTLVKIGFSDSRKKIFNLRFKILILLLVLMFIMPWAIGGNMYGMYYLTGNPLDSDINIRAIFSTSVDLTSYDYYGEPEATNNMAGVIIKVLLTFAVEAAVAVFAYMRGKKAFIAKHMSKDKDYQTDENI